MQHKTIGKVTETVKDAKTLEFKSMTSPVEQWDHLAFSVVYQELAPKGFKKFQNGHWKGAEHADIPFLSKKQVIKTQKMAAQLVRGYRSQAQAHINKIKDIHLAIKNKLEKELLEIPFYMFRRRARLRRALYSETAWISALDEVIEKLNLTPIK